MGARPLKVGDTLELRAEPRDARGRPVEQREASWSSSDSEVAGVDSTGVVVATASGSATITATAEGKSGSVRITVLPQPRTSRTEIASAQQPSLTPPPVDPAAEWRRLIDQLVAGVDRCYGALRRKDMVLVTELYRPATKADGERLNKLARILQTREWSAQVGEREDGAQRLENGSATMEFGFRLTWKDAFGGRLSSRPVFRAEFTRSGEKLDLATCRIVNSPKL
jgi:hypothetical protein